MFPGVEQPEAHLQGSCVRQSSAIESSDATAPHTVIRLVQPQHDGEDHRLRNVW
jgi:hypothetical protein